MKVLVACEFSGVVRRAFRARGHEAWSCDLEPSWDNSPYHIEADIREVLNDQPWDLMIAHPPCTYLCSSGLHWNKRRPDREQKTEQALDFVKFLMYSAVDKICIENPIGCISTRIGRPSQIIQPWQFGHPESKATCLWLKGLPLLVPTNILEKPSRGYWDNQTPSGQNKLGPSEDRGNKRAVTYEGIGLAMAEQWG